MLKYDCGYLDVGSIIELSHKRREARSSRRLSDGKIKIIRSINLDQVDGLIEGRVMRKSVLKRWEKNKSSAVLFSVILGEISGEI